MKNEFMKCAMSSDSLKANMYEYYEYSWFDCEEYFHMTIHEIDPDTFLVKRDWHSFYSSRDEDEFDEYVVTLAEAIELINQFEG